MAAASYVLTMAALTYGLGDIGTPGQAGAYDPAPPAAVPLPGAIWLFVTALGLIAARTRIGRVIPQLDRGIQSLKPSRHANALQCGREAATS